MPGPAGSLARNCVWVSALAVFVDLLAADKDAITEQRYVLKRINLAEHYGPSRAARFLQSKNTIADRASVTEYEADRMKLETATEAPGLLVLSKVYYPAWKVYANGSPAPIYVADHLLRSVPVPEGEHEVELRYESWTLRAGIVI